MTRYEVFLSKTAVRQLHRLPGEAERRIKAKLKNLEEDPRRPRPGADIRLLSGSEDPPLYRLRVGDYRILFFVLTNEVRVTEILPRSRAYRGID